jgi:hypothetical protein
MTIQELEKYLSIRGCELHGCSTAQIDKLERLLAVSLPLCYKEFLLAMGNGAGQFMKGSSAFYDEIFDLKEASMELLIDDNVKPLPDGAFVFWMHQGYQFAFFHPDEGDNPSIYFYHEGESHKEFERKEESFTDFLEKQLILSGLK